MAKAKWWKEAAMWAGAAMCSAGAYVAAQYNQDAGAAVGALCATAFGAKAGAMRAGAWLGKTFSERLPLPKVPPPLPGAPDEKP